MSDSDEDPKWLVDYAEEPTRYDEDWLAAEFDRLERCDLSEDDYSGAADTLVGRSDDGGYLIFVRPDGGEYAVPADVEAGPDDLDLNSLEWAPNPAPEQPPAHTLDQWLQARVPKRSYDRIYSQIILDIREEHAEALAKNEIAPRLVIVRGYLSVAWALFTELRFVGAVTRVFRGS
jgi:hypothetical protein